MSAEACICNTGPSTDGPEEDCPQHGRPYSYWVEWGDVLAQRLAAVEALATEWEVLADYVDDPDSTADQRARSRAGVIAAAQLRAALTAEPEESA